MSWRALPLLLFLTPVLAAGQEAGRFAGPLSDASLTQSARASRSPDGKTIATAGDKIRITDAATGELLRELRPGAPVTAVAFAPRGRLLAAADVNQRVSLWAIASATRLTDWQGHAANVRALAFAPDGATLASGDNDGTIALWQVMKGKPRWLRRVHDGAIRVLAFSASGKLLASCGDDGVIRLWEVITGRPVLAIPARARLGPGGVAFAADGRTLFWTEPVNPAVFGWDLAAGKALRKQDLLRVEIAPREIQSKPGEVAAVRVLAHWSDGRAQDVTALARYEASESDTLRLAPSGRLVALRPGRAAVVARYLGRTAATIVTVRETERGPFPAFAAHNLIDDILLVEWKQAGFRPAAPLADVRFLKRVYVQLLGTIPTPAEVRRFQANKDPDRRRKLIDELLARPEYADYWGLEWAQLLGVDELPRSPKARAHAHAWLRDALARNWSATRIVRDLLLAEGKVTENGAAALAAASGKQLAPTVAQALLGINLACARCHAHPDGHGGPEDYHGLAACFAEVSAEPGPEPRVHLVPGVRLLDPAGKPIAARPPGGAPFSAAGQRDPRRALADWMTAPDNPALARNLVNRYWAHFYGEGLVEPVDGAQGTTRCLHPILLNALTKDFLAHGCDLKRLVRMLCQAQTYQLGDDPASAGKSADGSAYLFARRVPKHLKYATHERLYAVACGLPPPEPAEALGPGVSEAGPFSLRRQRYADRTCERHPETPVSALFLMGSEKVSKMLAHPKGRVVRLLNSGLGEDGVLDELFLATLLRLPTPDERKRVHAHLRSRDGHTRQELFVDVMWALLNSREFVVCP
jgi:hypothetical protein